MSFRYHYTHKNHLQCDFDPIQCLCKITVGSFKKTTSGPFAEAARAAQLIQATNITDKIVLCLSGGIDSEAMALAFIFAGVDFEVAIFKYNGGMNFFDYRSALKFCLKNKLTFKVYEFDVLKFLESDLFMTNAKKYRCRSPQFLVHIELLKMIDGLPVLAWEPLMPLYIKKTNSVLLNLPEEHQFAYVRYAELEQKKLVPFFFCYTPELINSFYQLELFKENIRQNPPNTTYAYKVATYQQAGFNVKARARKFTGFEKIKDFYTDKTNPTEWIFEKRFRWPLIELNPLPQKLIYELNLL